MIPMRFFRHTCKILAVFSFLLVLNGCGYTTHSSIYPAGTSICVSQVKNKINFTDESSENTRLVNYFPMLETKITNAVVDRFITDGNLKIGKADTCDLILESEVVRYARDALQYFENNEDVKEYRVTLFVNLALKDRDGKIIFQESNFGGDATYYTQGSLAKSETSAVEDAITDLSRRIVERVVESW